MFRDVSICGAHFESNELNSKASVCIATAPLLLNENETQTEILTQHVASQTETRAVSSKKKSKKSDAMDKERVKIRNLLDSVGSMMLWEVKHSAVIATFHSGRPNGALNCISLKCCVGLEKLMADTYGKQDVIQLMTLQFDSTAYFHNKLSDSTSKNEATRDSIQLSCTGVSWNATGSIVGISYGRFDHSGWCNYRSALCLWNVFANDFDPLKPMLVLQVPSGLMCVAYHPKNPSVVAAGSFTGEVFVWDLEPQEYRLYGSSIGEYYHQEPVTKVEWVYDITTSDYHIASVSGDGKVLFWRVKDKRLDHPIEGYIMHSVDAHTKEVARKTGEYVLGGKSMGFSHDKTSRTFVIGSEGGQVARCFAKSSIAMGKSRLSDLFKGEKKWTVTACRLVGMLPSEQLSGVRHQVETYATEKRVKEITLGTVYEARVNPFQLYPNAANFYFDPHAGPVYDVSFSPFRKNLFLTCSLDGTVRLYTYLQKDPLLVIEVSPTSSYLYAVAWSKTRPAVFGVTAEDGNVYIYDLMMDKIAPVVTLKKHETADGIVAKSTSPMLALDFNPRQRNFVAAGDAAGKIYIWKLSWRLANLQSDEMTVLEALETAA